ncbi:hypothetical protein V9L05_18260 [Bernardetia sp. Wsw4-3y2]|uniref:hypothetical protein n=1 Tax=Bernardetia sp. Wsw4-3y2 TaxID=3127471 RepID=UPI0030D0AF56
MKKYLITFIIVLAITTACFGYQKSISIPVLEFVIHGNTTIFLDDKFYDIIKETTIISNAPIGHYEMDYEEFDVDEPNTTVVIIYK